MRLPLAIAIASSLPMALMIGFLAPERRNGHQVCAHLDISNRTGEILGALAVLRGSGSLETETNEKGVGDFLFPADLSSPGTVRYGRFSNPKWNLRGAVFAPGGKLRAWIVTGPYGDISEFEWRCESSMIQKCRGEQKPKFPGVLPGGEGPFIVFRRDKAPPRTLPGRPDILEISLESLHAAARKHLSSSCDEVRPFTPTGLWRSIFGHDSSIRVRPDAPAGGSPEGNAVRKLLGLEEMVEEEDAK